MIGDDMIKSLVRTLSDKDNKAAYAALLKLRELSENSEAVYPYLDEFIMMLDDESSYIRSRGLALIIANAQWDSGNKIATHIDDILAHVTDRKPITSRQFIQSLPPLAADKPLLKTRIISALKSADTSIYKDTMRPLVDKDIRTALAAINRK